MLALTRSIRSAAAVTLLLSVAEVAYAQVPMPGRQGVSPRIRIPAGNPALNGGRGGTVIAWDSGGVTILRRPQGAAPDTVRIAPASRASFEPAARGTSTVGRGALIGGLVLGAAGLAMALTADGCGDSCYSPSPAVGVMSMAAVGAGIGALVGLVVRGDRWEPASRAGED